TRHVRTFTDAEGAWNLHAASHPKPAPASNATSHRSSTPCSPNRAATTAVNRATPTPSTPSNAPSPAPVASRATSYHLALLRVDLYALVRGDVEAGEVCEITGIGPVPATVARDLLGEAIAKLVITKGVDVLHVTHLGRGPSVAQKIA